MSYILLESYDLVCGKNVDNTKTIKKLLGFIDRTVFFSEHLALFNLVNRFALFDVIILQNLKY